MRVGICSFDGSDENVILQELTTNIPQVQFFLCQTSKTKPSNSSREQLNEAFKACLGMSWRVAAKKYALLVLKSDYSGLFSQQKSLTDDAICTPENNYL